MKVKTAQCAIGFSLYDFWVHRSTLDERFFNTCLKQNLPPKTENKY